jgi:hypothetical protein
MENIFDFWSRIKRGERIHPADKKVFKRIDAERHGFQLDCLPGCFAGPLKKARVVLLYLSPGHDQSITLDARTREGKEHHFRTYRGVEPLRDEGPGRKWVESRTKRFGAYADLKHNLAILNIGAYHSKNVKDYASLLALPSSRVSLAWAQDHLFPEAEAGKANSDLFEIGRLLGIRNREQVQRYVIRTAGQPKRTHVQRPREATNHSACPQSIAD